MLFIQRHLVKGLNYPKDILDLEYNPRFPVRGLWFDRHMEQLFWKNNTPGRCWIWRVNWAWLEVIFSSFCYKIDPILVIVKKLHYIKSQRWVKKLYKENFLICSSNFQSGWVRRENNKNRFNLNAFRRILPPGTASTIENDDLSCFLFYSYSMDRQYGNLLKVDQFGKILRCCHGFRSVLSLSFFPGQFRLALFFTCFFV